jgi:predicted  nucleic acid-binding Zn-ribbon protein
MAPAEKGTTSLKKTSATVRSAPLITKLRSSTQEDHQAETNNVMFSQLLEALQAITSQMVTLTDRIANLEMQQTSTPTMSDTLNTILQRLDRLEQENQLMRKAMETKTFVSVDLTSMNNSEPAISALHPNMPLPLM